MTNTSYALLSLPEFAEPPSSPQTAYISDALPSLYCRYNQYHCHHHLGGSPCGYMNMMWVSEGCQRIHPTTPNSWMQIRPAQHQG